MANASPSLSQAFKPSAWIAHIDFMKRLWMKHHVLVAVLAEAGGGKSTFIELLRLKLGTTFRTLVFQAQSDFAESAFFKAMAKQLDIQPVASCEALFQTIGLQTPSLFLMIDDAHHLPEPFLFELVRAYQAHAASVRLYICLLSDFGLTPMLSRLEKSSNQVHAIQLGALTPVEMRTYVLKQLPHTALATQVTPARLSDFYTLTQGFIAQINEQAAGFFDPNARHHWRGRLLHKQKWTLTLLLGMFMSFAAGWGLFHSTAMSVLATQERPMHLLSHIPGWYEGVAIQATAPSPMKKFVSLPEENEEPSTVLLDKVVVIPDLS